MIMNLYLGASRLLRSRPGVMSGGRPDQAVVVVGDDQGQAPALRWRW
ncbi:hypothetical protein [Mesorhizobium ciceri]